MNRHPCQQKLKLLIGEAPFQNLAVDPYYNFVLPIQSMDMRFTVLSPCSLCMRTIIPKNIDKAGI